MKPIILCADDYGQSEAISQAIVTLLEKKRLSAVSCITTLDHWSKHAKQLFPFKNKIDIGLHLNLTLGRLLSPLLINNQSFKLSSIILRSYLGRLNAKKIEYEFELQLDNFSSELGRLPDFIDGHQHIHQLPIIREGVMGMFLSKLKTAPCYIRSISHEFKIFSFNQPAYFKSIALQCLGASYFKKLLTKNSILHNSSFGGIYSLNPRTNFPRVFLNFAHEIGPKGLIMCHPSLLSDRSLLTQARFNEFKYFNHSQFLLDCKKMEIKLSRFLDKIEDEEN